MSDDRYRFPYPDDYDLRAEPHALIPRALAAALSAGHITFYEYGARVLTLETRQRPLMKRLWRLEEL